MPTSVDTRVIRLNKMTRFNRQLHPALQNPLEIFDAVPTGRSAQRVLKSAQAHGGKFRNLLLVQRLLTRAVDQSKGNQPLWENLV